MSTRDITAGLVAEVTADLRERYGLDQDDVRELGARLAGAGAARTAENRAFAERFTREHHETFDRLGR